MFQIIPFSKEIIKPILSKVLAPFNEIYIENTKYYEEKYIFYIFSFRGFQGSSVSVNCETSWRSCTLKTPYQFSDGWSGTWRHRSGVKGTIFYFFCYLVKCDLSSVRYCKSVYWTSRFLHHCRTNNPTRKTWPSFSGRVVKYDLSSVRYCTLLHTYTGQGTFFKIPQKHTNMYN